MLRFLPRLCGFTIGIVVVSLVLSSGVRSGVESPIRPGETIRYDLRYVGARGGIMNVRTDTDVVDGRPVWTTRLRLRTAGRLNDLYSVDDRLVGYWHTGRHRSLGYDYHENHGGDRESEIVRYHHEEGFYTENGQRAGPLRPGTLDLASALFAMRSRTIRPGQRQEWTIQVTGDTYHVLSRVDAVEVVRVPGLTVRAHRVRLRPKDPEAYRTMKSWLEEDAEGLYIWFSTDPLQIPLRVRAATMIGTVEAVLTEYDRADDA